MYLDHVFIITEPDAPEARHLAMLGLREGPSNVHPGQGTANRRFFLDNLTIELLFVSDAVEADGGAGKELGVFKRYTDKTACPFGIVTRVTDSETVPDFSAWQYYPDYFPDNMCFYVGDNSKLIQEPLCICMPPTLPKADHVPDQYANPAWKLTDLTIHSPLAEFSTTLKHFATIEGVTLRTGPAHLMTLRFNNGATGNVQALRPELPVEIEW
jgi:hypothetical protein